jgi:hypothetical protein
MVKVLKQFARLGSKKAAATSSAAGDPPEIERLTKLMLQRIGDQPEARDEDFLKYRFAAPLRNYRTWGGWYGFAFTVLSVGTIAAGLGSSGIVAGWDSATWARWTILVLGLLGGVMTAINQLWRPGQKSTSRMRGANALCSEGWAFIQERGKYRNGNAQNPREAFGKFVDEVTKIVQLTVAVDGNEPAAFAQSSQGGAPTT